MNIFSRLDNLTDLTTNEQTLVDYMKNNPERFINMSADEISAACFISIPTIYRLCKKLELNGLAQLKVMVSTSIRDYLKENGLEGQDGSINCEWFHLEPQGESLRIR